MSTSQSNANSIFRSRMVLRLWLIMMLLVLLSIAFIWVVQIFLFEQNYVDSMIAEVQSTLEPIMEDLKTEDLALNEKLLPYLSKSINGKMMLIDADGNLLSMYSYGHLMNTEEAKASVWHIIKDSPEYGQLLRGEQYSKVIEYDSRMTSVEFGIPVVYDGKQAYIILYQTLDGLYTVLDINRRQLFTMSILLAVVAALLAAVLAKQFTKPIHTIKNTVKDLAKGNLEATPGLHRKDELGQLSDSVAELGQALQRVDVLRKEVIANVSHELRSPLALIVGYAEMVRDISWKDEEKRNDNLNLIISESRRLSEMVSDIMDYSQIQSGYVQIKKDWYNLYEVVESEIAHCEQSAAQHRIRIDLNSDGSDIPVYVDALKIARVMRNLLYNAINHTADEETITVTIKNGKGEIRVMVQNPGDPIPPEDREIIWERYHRSQHQGGRKQGTGLGLSIVSTILKAHDMSYGVDCIDGMTIFWFSYRGLMEET